MIDVSDGLASDLYHIINMSGNGAQIQLAQIPVSMDAQNINDSLTPLEHALYDGEDFELLFTLSADAETEFMTSWNKTFDLPCTRIGKITDKKDIIECIDNNGTASKLKSRGYEHYKTPNIQ